MGQLSVFTIVFIAVLTLSIIAILFMQRSKGSNQSWLEKRIYELEGQNKKLTYDLGSSVQEVISMKERISDWERTKQEFIASSNAASLDATKKLTEQLLTHNNAQAKHTADQTTKRISESTKHLHDSYQELFSSVKILKENLTDNANYVDTIRRALSSSNKVGYASEVVLENTLNAFGLVEGRDFHLQKTIAGEGSHFRPDAIIFLPAGNTIIVDSKATKFIFDLAQAEKENDSSLIKKARAGVKSSMERHLKDLTKKDYHSSVKRYLKSAGKDTSSITITTIMWLPSDGAIDRLRDIDINFNLKAGENNIYECGPSAMWAVIGIASQKIKLERQTKNQIKITEAAEKLLSNISTLVDNANKLDRGLSQATSSWDNFTKSFNARFLPSAKEITRLGIPSKKPLLGIGSNADDSLITISGADHKPVP